MFVRVGTGKLGRAILVTEEDAVSGKASCGVGDEVGVVSNISPLLVVNVGLEIKNELAACPEEGWS